MNLLSESNQEDEIPKSSKDKEESEPIEDNIDDLLEDLDSLEIDTEEILIDYEEDVVDSDKVVDATIVADVVEEADNISKHKQTGKHALKYDTIFKGKKTNYTEEELNEVSYNNDIWNPDVTTNFHYEVYNNEKYIREKDLKEKVYKVLCVSTEIDFECNRRKPSKVDFNNYFFILKTALKDDGFSNVEIFNELSYYFSDNLMNMFKLLDNKWRNLVIDELQDHIGKINSDKTIVHRNIPIGTEIEFKWIDQITLADILITGEVFNIEKIEEEKWVYLTNSYEKEYRVEIEMITKILNNTKFKYNLNKLNNIDFL